MAFEAKRYLRRRESYTFKSTLLASMYARLIGFSIEISGRNGLKFLQATHVLIPDRKAFATKRYLPSRQSYLRKPDLD